MSFFERLFKPDPHEIHPWRWRMLTVWIVIFTAVVMYAIYENKARVHDIQQSRVYSCQQTKLDFRHLILLSVRGKKLNDGQKARLKLFLDNENPQSCFEQTSPDRRPVKTTK